MSPFSNKHILLSSPCKENPILESTRTIHTDNNSIQLVREGHISCRSYGKIHCYLLVSHELLQLEDCQWKWGRGIILQLTFTSHMKTEFRSPQHSIHRATNFRWNSDIHIKNRHCRNIANIPSFCQTQSIEMSQLWNSVSKWLVKRSTLKRFHV